MNVKVVVSYSDKLENIIVDGSEMPDLNAIKNKLIKDWFIPSYSRDGWEGLIEEIKK